MAEVFDTADLSDVPQLLRLFRRADALGAEPVTPCASPDELRLVARHPADGIVAAIAVTIDRADRLARLHGLAVDPLHRGRGLGLRAVRELTDRVLATGLVDSLYTTDFAAREAFVGNGFRAMGFFPNPRLGTAALLVRHREGVLSRRIPVTHVPTELNGLLAAAGMGRRPAPVPMPRHQDEPSTAELIDAPRFVADRFRERVPVRFHPFHAPNAILAATDFELYLHLNRRDGYCALVGATPNAMAVAAHLDGIIRQLTDLGAPYLETLLPLHAGAELSELLAHGFLPAALYPALRPHGDAFHDYVVLARANQPPAVHDIDAEFRPFVEQYVNAWARQHLFLTSA